MISVVTIIRQWLCVIFVDTGIGTLLTYIPSETGMHISLLIVPASEGIFIMTHCLGMQLPLSEYVRQFDK